MSGISWADREKSYDFAFAGGSSVLASNHIFVGFENIHKGGVLHHFI